MLARKVELGSDCLIVSHDHYPVLRVRRSKLCEFTCHLQDSLMFELHFYSHLIDIRNYIEFKDLLNFIVLKSCQICWWLSSLWLTNILPIGSPCFIVPISIKNLLLISFWFLKTVFGNFCLILIRVLYDFGSVIVSNIWSFILSFNLP